MAASGKLYLPATVSQARAEQSQSRLRARVLDQPAQGAGRHQRIVVEEEQVAPARQGGTPEDVDALEARASRIDCAAALSSRPRMMTELSLEACIARCQMLFADRTKQQCVVLCNE